MSEVRIFLGAQVTLLSDDAWMQVALLEADQAAREGEVPVGCVLVGGDGRELARGRNMREQRADPTAHAEVVALREASRASRSWRLDGVTVYVTLEPCIMCAAALVHARVARLVYGSEDAKAGGVVSLYAIASDPRLNHQIQVKGGLRAAESSARLQEFFGRLRRAGKK